MEDNLDQIYSRDIKFFFDKIRKKEPFALLRFGDGEINQIMGVKRWHQVTDRSVGYRLFDSLIYKGGDYYIGLPFKFTELDSINSNYYFKNPRGLAGLARHDKKYFFDVYIFSETKGTIDHKLKFWDELFDLVESNTIKINWICNEEVKKNPPKFINKFLFVRDGCWQGRCEDCMIEILNYIDDVEDELFMFSAGVFANVLVHNAWIRNKKNMYVDIGKVLDCLVFDPESLENRVQKGHISRKDEERIIKRWNKLR